MTLQYNDKFRNFLEDEVPKINSVTEFVNFCNFYGALFASNPCSYLYSDNIENKIKDFQSRVPFVEDKSEAKTLHVATQIYATGGHTRVIENWIDNLKDEQHDVVLVSQIRRVNLKLPVKSKLLILPSSYSNEEKIQELNQLYARYKTIIFHIHPYDTIPIVAIGKHDKKKFSLFNHADHIFNIGHSNVSMTYDLSTTGSQFSLNFRKANQSKVIPVPIRYSSLEETANFELPENSFLVLSIGTEYKFTPTPDVNLLKFAEEFCEQYEGALFVFVGPGTEFKEKLGVHHPRVHCLGRVDYARLKSLYQQANIYLDSLPIGGGIAILEAALNNCPIVAFESGLNLFDSIRPFAIQYADLKTHLVTLKDNATLRSRLASQAYSLAQNHIGEKWKNHLLLEPTKFQSLDSSKLEKYLVELATKYPRFTLPNSPYWLRRKVLLRLASLLGFGIASKIFIKQLIFKFFYKPLITLDEKFRLKRFLN